MDNIKELLLAYEMGSNYNKSNSLIRAIAEVSVEKFMKSSKGKKLISKIIG
jgi:hypothetical protein